MSPHGWIGVDLDGTLAEYHGWKGLTQIGAPVPVMIERVKKWIAEGREVRIVTARATRSQSIPFIEMWLVENGLPELEITDRIDFEMIEFWSDRCISVIQNRGEPWVYDLIKPNTHLSKDME